MVSKQPTVAKATRQSNFELLRIVAMFLVLGLHVNYNSLGAVTQSEVLQAPAAAFWRMLLEALCLVCVNSFVLVSGYFSIKLTRRSFLSFLFILVFWRIFCTAVMLPVPPIPETHFTVADYLLNLVPALNEWFSLSYLIMMLLAPGLNAIAERLPRKQLLQWILLFYAIEFAFGYIKQTTTYFGYTPISLCLLYLIGRYLKLYPPERPTTGSGWMALYVGICIFSTGIFYTLTGWTSLPLQFIYSHFMSYISPLVILASVAFFMAFSKLRIQSKAINWIATGTFAVYIGHMNPLVAPYFYHYARALHTELSTALYVPAILAYMVGVFTVCVLIDKLRQAIWTRIAGR